MLILRADAADAAVEQLAEAIDRIGSVVVLDRADRTKQQAGDGDLVGEDNFADVAALASNVIDLIRGSAVALQSGPASNCRRRRT
jgi:hypothetical protein